MARAVVVLVLALTPLLARTGRAQETESTRVWSAGLDVGYGSLGMTADQGRDEQFRTFVLAFRGSRALGPHLRLGAEFGGSLIEAFDAWDPAKGASVSTSALFAQLFPCEGAPLYLEAEAGIAYYANAGPLEFGSHGTGWSLGAGWEFRRSSALRIAPRVSVSGGAFRDIRNPIKTETGLKYSAWDVRLSTTYHFGRRAR